MNYLSSRLNSIRRIWCFSYSLSAMALTEWEFMSDDDPWKVSAFVSAIVELFLLILLLLGAAIAFITSRFAKFFGLEPPCTYIGCAHPVHSEALRGQMLRTPPSRESKDLCRGEFCPNCHPLRIHSKSHSEITSVQEEGSGAFDSSDHSTREQDLDGSSGHYGEHQGRWCSCSRSPQNRRRRTKHTTFIHTASTSNKLSKDDYPLPFSRSCSESSDGFDANHRCEIFQAPADSEEEWAWKGTYVKNDKIIDNHVPLAHEGEVEERNRVSRDFKEKSHGISLSLLESRQEESAEISPLHAVTDEVEELRVSNNFEHRKREDNGLVNRAIYLGDNIQGTCFNVSESGRRMQHSKVLMSKDHVESIDQNVDEDGCLQNSLVAAHLSSLELSSQEAIVEGLQEASLDGADAPCEKDGRLLEDEQGRLLLKDPRKGVEDVSDDAIATKDEPAFINALAKCGGSSEHAEEQALPMSPIEAEDNEEESILEEEQEEGLDALKLALLAERSVLAALEAELENERNAAAVATSEAMAMISRLQEEKSAMQMEVAQLQRMSEEKADYDEQAMALLKEILYKREKENIALEKEVELYRETLSAEKADDPMRCWLSEGTENPSPQSLKPLLLTGGEEFLSPIADMKQKQALALAFSEVYQSGTRSDPWIRQHGPGSDLEEPDALSLDQNVNKRSTDFPMNHPAASMSLRVWDEEGRPRYHLDGDLHGPHYNSEQLKKTGRSVFSTNDQETQSVLERLWVLEEELQKLRGKDSVGSQSKADGDQRLAGSPTHRKADKSLTEAWGGQIVCGNKSKEQREEAEMDGVAEGFVPIHDVYEVQSTSNRSPPFAEERDLPEGFEDISGNLGLLPVGISESFSAARMARHRTPIPPRILPAKKLFPSDEAPSTPVLTPQAAGWIVGKCLHSEDVCDQLDLHKAQSVVLREDRGAMNEDIQQLAVRLKVLEEDRELLRETLESFKHREAELNLLQEIAQHLRELRMAGFMNVSNVSGGIFREDVTVTSPSKNRAVKKRRYCSGPGQAQMPPLHKRSI